MRAPIDRIMETYGMMLTLTPEQEADARRRVERFLSDQSGSDQELAVLGVKYLRDNYPIRPRRRSRVPVNA